MPEATAFKGMMIPTAIMIMFFWNTAYYWLIHLRKNNHGLGNMRILGILAALFLIIYIPSPWGCMDTCSGSYAILL
jgi:hypothetical protein